MTTLADTTIWAMCSALGLSVACGADDAAHPIASGLYQLTTPAVTGTCKLDNALGPGALMVGATLPVAVAASSVAIAVRVCGHPDEAAACAGAGDAFDFGLSRDGDAVAGSQLWLVPGCGDPNIDATLTVSGNVTAPDTLSIEWTATINSMDPGWSCSGYAPCTATVEQRLAPIVPSS